VPDSTVGYLLKMYPRFSETFVLNELLELERQGVRLHVFSLKKPDDGIFHAGVSRLRAPVTYLPESPLLQPRAYAAAHRAAQSGDRARYASALAATLARRSRSALKQFLRAGYVAPLLLHHEIRHVHAHFASTAASVALHAHRLTGVSYSVTAHAKDIYRDDIDRRQLAAKLEEARFVVTVSDYNARRLSQLAPQARVVRIYNGLDLDRLVPNGRVRNDPPLVLAVGRLVEKKGFHVLVRACALLRDRGVPFRCAIVGKGPLERDLGSLAGNLGLEGRVELRGAVPADALVELYRHADVVAAPCVVEADGNRDGLPTVLIEAMALGVPVVATDVTGIPELVEHERTGLLVRQGDPVSLANSIQRVLNDPPGAAALAAAGRAQVERNFQLRANVSQLRSLFEEALAT
jgi:colanic acid/amylovoran biosynthesis glycosyltransferase